MPVMDGMELLGQIKEQYPKIHVVVATAFGTIDVAKTKFTTFNHKDKTKIPSLQHYWNFLVKQKKYKPTYCTYLSTKQDRIKISTSYATTQLIRNTRPVNTKI